MKYITALITLLTFLFPALSHAEEALNCTAFEKEIRDDIGQLGSCWKDSDCVLFDFGCPWQVVPCHMSIISRIDEDENIAVAEKVEKFTAECVAKNKELKQRCDLFNNQMAKTQCNADQHLICLDGQCTTQNDILLQGVE